MNRRNFLHGTLAAAVAAGVPWPRPAWAAGSLFGLTLPDAGGTDHALVDYLGKPLVVNFWATWCPPCIEEHPVLMAMQAQKIPIWGIVYKDKAEAALDYLRTRGNPYVRNAIDAPGRVAIDWGLTGVPETFLVDGDGFVRWHMSGAISRKMVAEQIEPLMKKYSR